MRCREIFTTAFCLLLSANLLAKNTGPQTETLLGGDIVYAGWFVGLPLAATELHDTPAALPGFEGGIVLSDGSRVGFKSQAMFLRGALTIDAGTGPEVCDLEGGYGGLLVSPALFGTKPIHVSLPLVAAMGHVVYVSQAEYLIIDEDGERDFDRQILDQSTFFNFEPGIALEVNVTRFAKISLGGSYRLFYGLRLNNLDTDALNGPSARLEAIFGRF